ncbi:MAG TPA: DUF1003 domain-containing protein [Bacteroidales bacterium]|nr:DUF1003 domain-containing protein [Bacteroidales bacterium]
MDTVTCFISKKVVGRHEAYQADTLHPVLLDFIRREFPDIRETDYISIEEINLYRRKLLATLFTEESGELSDMEKEVLASIHDNKILSENIEPDIQENLSFGQRLADRIADFGGSWGFILIFFTFILLWMLINIYLLVTRAFDPYPFILLNLILSCLAAIQAPIIMMSQNRQEQKDRLRGEHDYKVNLKAELEIRLLHEKIDHLIIHQNKRLLEIQAIQTDYLNDILTGIKGQ